MKEIISDYHQHFEQKLQDLSNHLSDYYEKFIAESKRLIDLSIRKSHMFLRHITELLKELLQSATANDMSLYSGLLQKNLLSPSNVFKAVLMFSSTPIKFPHSGGWGWNQTVCIDIITHWASPGAGSWLQAEAHVNWAGAEAGVRSPKVSEL